MRTRETTPNKNHLEIKEALEEQFHFKSYCEKSCDIINRDKNTKNVKDKTILSIF